MCTRFITLSEVEFLFYFFGFFFAVSLSLWKNCELNLNSTKCFAADCLSGIFHVERYIFKGRIKHKQLSFIQCLLTGEIYFCVRKIPIVWPKRKLNERTKTDSDNNIEKKNKTLKRKHSIFAWMQEKKNFKKRLIVCQIHVLKTDSFRHFASISEQ